MNYSTCHVKTGESSFPCLYRPDTSDRGVIGQIFEEQGLWLRRLRRIAEIQSFCFSQAKNGKRPLVIDAGANIGASALYFSLHIPNAHVIAIEPELSNFNLLKSNSDGHRIEPIRAAVAAKPCRLNVADPGLSKAAFRTTPAQDGVLDQSVEGITINTLYQRHASDCFPFIVKIDIEGAESDLFSDNTEWVARAPIIIIELHDWMLPGEANSLNFLKCISAHNRDFVYIGEHVFSIMNPLAPEVSDAPAFPKVTLCNDSDQPEGDYAPIFSNLPWRVEREIAKLLCSVGLTRDGSFLWNRANARRR